MLWLTEARGVLLLPFWFRQEKKWFTVTFLAVALVSQEWTAAEVAEETNEPADSSLVAFVTGIHSRYYGYTVCESGSVRKKTSSLFPEVCCTTSAPQEVACSVYSTENRPSLWPKRRSQISVHTLQATERHIRVATSFSLMGWEYKLVKRSFWANWEGHGHGPESTTAHTRTHAHTHTVCRQHGGMALTI